MITLRKDGTLLPEGNVGLQEYEALHVEIRPDPAISDVPRLTLDGVDLNPGPSVKHDGSGLVFTWVFRPECWCGRMQLHASHGYYRSVVNVTVSAAANKLDAGEYDAMLSRVLARASALPWGLAPGQVDASLGDGPQLGALHPVVVANLLPGLMKQLRRIIAEPVLALRPSEAVVALRRGMRLDVAERRALMSRPDRRQRLQGGDPTLTMVRRRRTSSLDHPANRWVVGTIARLRRALLCTGTLLDEVPAGWGDLERARAALLAREARAGEAEIGAALDGSDFAELPPGPLSESASLVLADHPAYAGFNRVARRMLAASVQMDSSGAIEASLRRTWDLFEFDCLFRVIDHLEDALGPTWRSQYQPLRHTILAEIPRGEFWWAEDGQGGRWSLHSQQTFSGTNEMTRTISTERRPDFVLTYQQGGQLVRWILFDAKYRVGRQGITDALADMHVYRDSLRWVAGQEMMAAEAGYLIVPAVGEATQEFATPNYRATHRFGLVTLNDGDFFKALVGSEPPPTIGYELDPPADVTTGLINSRVDTATLRGQFRRDDAGWSSSGEVGPYQPRGPSVMIPQTSDTNPLRIATVPLGGAGGQLGLTFAPGKKQRDGATAWHRRDLGMDLDAIAAWNAAVVVTLVEAHELDTLGIADIGREVRRRHMEWHHWPISDYQVPGPEFMAAWPERSAMLRGVLARGGQVLVHCKGGLGRAGSVAARLLVENGMAADAAIAAVRAARPGAIETPDQEAWVVAGRPTPLPQPDRSRSAARDRAVGALLGLAVGDALGAAIEFEPKPWYARLDDLQAGGPHRLKRGEWTDDTAMALALGESLMADPALDADNLMRRFLDWFDTGAYSCTGTCFDIGIQTRSALERYRHSGVALAGSKDPAASGNGALMRLAPVAIRHWRDREALANVADRQTRTTHGSPETVAASSVFASMLAGAIEGVGLGAILAKPEAEAIGWRGLHRDAVEGSGYVVRSLQAAVWAVSRSTNFRSAVLLAANLGQDADTTAAIAGQLAGAVYGASGIPAEWIDAVVWHDRLAGVAGGLFDAGWPDGDVAAGTPDRSLRERLEALAAFRPVFERDGFSFARTIPSQSDSHLIVLGGSSPGDEATRFYQMLYDFGWVRAFDWSVWRESAAGQKLMHNASTIEDASPDDLARVLTTCVRADRFCDGYLADAFEAGMIMRVVVRAEALLRAM